MEFVPLAPNRAGTGPAGSEKGRPFWLRAPRFRRLKGRVNNRDPWPASK